MDGLDCGHCIDHAAVSSFLGCFERRFDTVDPMILLLTLRR